MERLGEGCLSRILRRWLIQLIAGLIGLPLICGCLALLLFVVVPQLTRFDGNQFGAILIGGFIFLMVMIPLFAIGIWALVTWNRSRSYDAVFKPLGLNGSMYMLNGRQYHGEFAGRTVDIYIYRGPTIEVHLATSSASRFNVAEKKAVIQALNQTMPSVDLPWAEALIAYSPDPRWTADLMENDHAQKGISALMLQAAPWAIFKRVEHYPGEMLFHLSNTRNFTADTIQQQEVQFWLACLMEIAAAAETLPPPTVAIQPATSTRQSKQGMNKIQMIGIGLVLLMIPAFIILFLVIVWLVGGFS